MCDLTKREKFSLKAMKGLLASSDCDTVSAYNSSQEWKKDIIESAIEFADGLIEELEKTK